MKWPLILMLGLIILTLNIRRRSDFEKLFFALGAFYILIASIKISWDMLSLILIVVNHMW